MAHREGVAPALTYDPGADAATRLPDWVIRHHALRGIPEVLCSRRKVILIERSHDRASRRCSLAHAVAHIDLGHAATQGVLSARQELLADKLAARRLVDVQSLAAAMLWGESTAEIADELDVDEHMLLVRARHLHPAERWYLLRRLDTKEMTA